MFETQLIVTSNLKVKCSPSSSDMSTVMKQQGTLAELAAEIAANTSKGDGTFSVLGPEVYDRFGKNSPLNSKSDGVPIGSLW